MSMNIIMLQDCELEMVAGGVPGQDPVPPLHSRLVQAIINHIEKRYPLLGKFLEFKFFGRPESE